MKTTIILILIFILSLAFLFLVIWQVGRRDDDDYDRLYKVIDNNIDDLPVIGTSYRRIENLFAILKGLRYKNPEKTGVLWNKFLIKFKDAI